MVELFSSHEECEGVISFAHQLIGELKRIDKKRTADTYTAMLNSCNDSITAHD